MSFGLKMLNLEILLWVPVAAYDSAQLRDHQHWAGSNEFVSGEHNPGGRYIF